MEGLHGDPFLWDEEQVAQVLGASNCAWSKDPTSVAIKAREQEIDGQTLLKFDHLSSRQEFMDCLGIKALRHKGALIEEIFHLRSLSRGYHGWKTDFDRRQSGFYEELEEPVTNGHATPPTPVTSTGVDEARSSILQVQLSGIDGSNVEDSDPYSPRLEIRSSRSTPVPSSSVPNSFLVLPSPARKDVQLPTSAPQLPTPNSAQHPEDVPEDERTRKRRRIAPVALSTRPLHTSSAFIPTEADTLSVGKYLDQSEENDGLAWERAPKHAYLGDGRMTKTAIKSPQGKLSTRVIDLDDNSFTTSFPNTLPPGRILTVHRRTKNLLVKNSKKERLHNDGQFLMRSPSPSDDEDDEDDFDILDLPDTWDELTKQEIAEEKAERERLLGVKTGSLTRERVMAVLDEAIAAMTLNWEETKLLKYQRKAYRQWHAAQPRMANKRQKILKARMDANFYNDRIKRLYTEILDQKWQKEADVRNQAKILEQNLEDKLYQTWYAAMLDSRNPPPKPNSLPRPKRPTFERMDDFLEEELLESSDEDDFIVPDDGPVLWANDPMDIVEDYIKSDPGSPSLSFQGDPIYVDLTQTDTPERLPASKRKSVVIDLTSPLKPPEVSDHSPTNGKQKEDNLSAPTQADSDVIPPPLGELDSIEPIGKMSGEHWAAETDRWRLILCQIYKLTHSRRTALLALIHDKPLDDIWENSVQAQVRNPLANPSAPEAQTSAVAAFDLTLVFLSFARCKVMRVKRIANITQRIKTKLPETRRKWFEPFCKFIDEHAHLFPQDSQIYRADYPDGFGFESDEDDEFVDEAAGQSQRRKAPPKEIIQNKEAVDLRAEEQKRQLEQDARRQQLRANLAGLLPKDKTRLIINETKRDDQPFVYVNEDIGKQIMDHQVDGVRFLWNQLILDPKVRQGCLLAHTMGLGKTMQVITLLTAIAETAQSSDEAMFAQMPEDLRKSQTLILCPSSLVDNWMDELLMWAPEGILGQLRKIAATTLADERLPAVRAWATGGGVLVIGYPMFKKVVSDSEEAKELLLEKPNIVVADEAHKMKNKNTDIHLTCQNFSTKTRVALTGSPLANHVGEYYVMIDWVARNFLGPEAEFKEIYAKPIQEGLTVDSTRGEQRTAIKKLQVLKETVAPKVDRRTVNGTLKDVLPQKHEFVIGIPPTQLQSKLYTSFIDCFMQENTSGPLFAKVNNLGLICNHPHAFMEQVENVREKMAKSANPNDVFPSFPKGVIPLALKEQRRSDLKSPELSYKTKLLTIIFDEARRVGDKVLVFTQSMPTLNYLRTLCISQNRRFNELSGKTKISLRQAMTKDFNAGNEEIYLISTTAGGEGLNLQGANRVVIFDFKYNPVHDQQAVGRAYRIGQSKEVFVYRFVVVGTFEEDLQNRHVFKTQLASRVVDKKNPVSWGKRKGELFHHIEDRPTKDLKLFLGKDVILDKLIQCEGSIKSIVSTDTFEEEEPTLELTEAERQEVNELKIRFTNPEEYFRLQQQRSLDSQQRHEELLRAAHQHPALGFASMLSMANNVFSKSGQPSSSQPESSPAPLQYHQRPASTLATTDNHAQVCLLNTDATNQSLI